MTRPKAPLERKLLVALAPLLLGLTVACGFLWVRLQSHTILQGMNTQQLLNEPEILEKVVGELVRKAGGDWDSHPDPDVGRVMRPSTEKMFRGVLFTSNRMGMREREYAMPKPEGTLRIVLLGDSYIYGTKLPAEQRAGPLLEQYLRRGLGEDDREVEVLHLGLISWNFLSECSFLRRQVSLLQPDLVVHLTVPNDVDDYFAIRGFGGLARFSTQHRERADTLIQYKHPSSMMSIGRINYLSFGLDHESQGRFKRAAAEIARLRTAVEECGGEYFHLLRWIGNPEPILPLLLPDQPAERLAFLPETFSEDKANWVAPDDDHFGARGMELLAKYLYGEIHARNLLPGVELEKWPEAEHLRQSFVADAEAELEAPIPFLPNSWPLDGRLDFEPLDEEDSCHFNGGVDVEGYLSPYSSFTFYPGQPVTRLRLRGRGLDRPELRGVSLELAVDGQVIHTLEPGQGEELDLTLPLPEGLGDYPNVPLTADDYVYIGDDLRHCVAFQLQELAFE